jgi:hypothetical protein
MTYAPSTRVAHTANWFDSLLFLALMSGPPKFRDRDPHTSIDEAIDLVAVVHLVVWACGGLRVLARLYPAALIYDAGRFAAKATGLRLAGR